MCNLCGILSIIKAIGQLKFGISCCLDFNNNNNNNTAFIMRLCQRIQSATTKTKTIQTRKEPKLGEEVSFKKGFEPCDCRSTANIDWNLVPLNRSSH